MQGEQRLLFNQLQLAGLGIVILIIGLIKSVQALVYVGVGVFVLGLIRFVIFKKYFSKSQEEEQD
jgi:hypothetical protein